MIAIVVRHQRSALLTLSLAIGMLGGCGLERADGEPIALEPGDPAAYRPMAQLPCGAFPLEGLEARDGAETLPGPQFEALRRAIHASPDIDRRATWRLVHEEAERATFVAELRSAWGCIVVARQGGVWTEAEEAEASEIRVILGEGLEPARWQPTSVETSPDATTLRLLVEEPDCAGSSDATTRIIQPLVEYARDSVTITFGVRPVDANLGVACPSNRLTAAVLVLAKDVGDRVLLDGSVYPPREPPERLVPAG